ncbi:winged helix-turn-helix domain-containing protein [Xanthocytophaga flava]|uniref:winged helix-turn-helix domain-containing protein n=1 Tax=Xanthocytophaga flava TaxID=3048013 RepID=UPI0028D472C1|nr:winged helix-turn-helix domain-containing protein [Xanthocytophaga flavus]MDJ1467602.1 winged helix-turn-helix domain-containing protein [Xanthocytophaga flavus]
MKRTHIGGVLILLFISVICVAFRMTGNDDFDSARREILLRLIGHELLLQSGDSTSRVLPVKKIAGNEYQISFEHAFAFQPGSLVNTTQRLLAKDPLASEYVVNVLNCSDATIVYGYVISKNKKDDIVACIGRHQPLACYKINIKFKPTGIITSSNGYFLGSLTVLAFAGFIFLRSVKPPKALPDSPAIVTLGSMSFDTETGKLLTNGKTIDLTRTETRVLRIFALSPNEAIERSRLQKEIWEDEGVIVGRSLDMFISKLRKKLEFDPNIKIVVIRGKGYKLEISS